MCTTVWTVRMCGCVAVCVRLWRSRVNSISSIQFPLHKCIDSAPYKHIDNMIGLVFMTTGGATSQWTGVLIWICQKNIKPMLRQCEFSVCFANCFNCFVDCNGNSAISFEHNLNADDEGDPENELRINCEVFLWFYAFDYPSLEILIHQWNEMNCRLC